MLIDTDSAERFVHANARLLDRHRAAVVLHDAPTGPVLDALRAYRNPDGGFGHALEPDVRGPESQPIATASALGLLAEIDALDDPMVRGAADWLAAIAEPDGGIPFLLPSAARHPYAPFFGPPAPGGSFQTFAVTGPLLEAGLDGPWIEAATAWCWRELEHPDRLAAHGVRFGLEFLDRVPDQQRALTAIDRLRSRLDPDDGSVPVSGGKEDERLTPLALSPRPGGRSRTLFTGRQIEADLDRLERGQQDDGGWNIDYLEWSPGQAVEARGIMTVWVLSVLEEHGRLSGGRQAGR
jgi:hypothetical protein